MSTEVRFEGAAVSEEGQGQPSSCPPRLGIRTGPSACMGTQGTTGTQRTGVGKGSCCYSGGQDYKCTDNVNTLLLLLMKFPDIFF